MPMRGMNCTNLYDNDLLFPLLKCDMNDINSPYRVMMFGIGNLKINLYLFIINLKTISSIYMTILFY